MHCIAICSNNIIIMLVQAVNPARDGAGAVRAASTFNKTARIRVLGYRCICLKTYYQNYR